MLRLGIVDFDSSHSIEFTRRFNHVGVDSDQFVDGARVEVGWPGTSKMAPERIAGFTEQIAECGVELVKAAEDLLGRIDAVLILSLCGDAHLQRVRPFLEAGIPAFVDKPFACSLADARDMVHLAQKNGTVLFHASALRYADEIEQFQHHRAEYGSLYGVVSYGPAKRSELNPGLFHYGVHPTSILFALMGSGCQSVTSAHTEGAEVVTGCWQDGRLATLRGNRQGSTAYGFVAFCENGVVSRPVSSRYAYRNLCAKIVESFQNGRSDVDNNTSLEMVKFVLASLKSEANNGEPVPLESVA